MRTVLVFGTFDKLHEGHHAYLKFARGQGDTLVASVAQDRVIEDMKGRQPFEGLPERMQKLLEMKLVDDALSGDEVTGSWSAIHELKPDVIVVGYDQIELKDALEKLKVEKGFQYEIVVAPSHEGHKFHTSIIHK